MDDLESFTAAYMTACKGRAADHNMIGHWYFRQAWQEAVKQERAACAEICDHLWTRAGDADECANAIRARSGASRVEGAKP